MTAPFGAGRPTPERDDDLAFLTMVVIVMVVALWGASRRIKRLETALVDLSDQSRLFAAWKDGFDSASTAAEVD